MKSCDQRGCHELPVLRIIVRVKHKRGNGHTSGHAFYCAKHAAEKKEALETAGIDYFEERFGGSVNF